MGSSYVNTLVACDSSFMIQSLKEFHIPGIDYTFSINTTHVAMLLVSIFILIMAIVARELDVDGRIDSLVYSQNSPAGKKGESLVNRLFR